ncbi:MAG: helix-turn-helix domain-containing protein [Bacilli bacterium]
MKHDTEQLAVMSRRLGSKLRAIRQSNKLTIDQLADRVGISSLTLGGIERGEGNPTLAVIWRISNGLSIPITTLVSDDMSIHVSRLAESVNLRTHEDGFIVQPIFHAERSAVTEVYRGFLDPYVAYEAEAHAHGVVEIITVMQGELVIEVDDQIIQLQTFDAVRFHADMPHTYRNPGKDRAIFHCSIVYPTSTTG